MKSLWQGIMVASLYHRLGMLLICRMKALKIGNWQITTLTDLYLHVLKPQSSVLDAASKL
jgi:hypothetical protein